MLNYSRKKIESLQEVIHNVARPSEIRQLADQKSVSGFSRKKVRILFRRDRIERTQRFMYYIYLIQCEDGSIYTGITTDLERRFKEHSDKIGGHYTRAHKVEKVLYTEKYPTRSEALKRETEIKKLRREKKLDLIK